MRQNIKNSKTIVVKMGTSSVTHPNGKLKLKFIDQLARVLTDLENSGKNIILVSSGAIGCGMSVLNLNTRPKTLEGKQAAASIGQGLLMDIYRTSFNKYNQNVGQILLTKDVFNNSIKRNNAKNTFRALLDRRVIPIVNENDCISTDEIDEECFGDNDILSAMTADIVKADILIMLSDVNGLYDANPFENKAAKLIKNVGEITPEIYAICGKSCSSFGTGGMVTKIGAAKYATKHGIDTIIASGENADHIYDILDGIEIGTYFYGGSNV